MRTVIACQRPPRHGGEHLYAVGISLETMAKETG